MSDEQTLVQKFAENWPWITGVASTATAMLVLLRHRVKQHYQNPRTRKSDMDECRTGLTKGIEENKQAIDRVENHINDCFKEHNKADRVRTENILMTIAGMNNGRG